MTEHILDRYDGTISQDGLQRLRSVVAELDLMADLNEADMFIDCFREDGVAIVAAQAKPRGIVSNYNGSAVGHVAKREDEPAVYQAFESGLPLRDLKAITQERRRVMQDVAPIRTQSGECVGVLIAERDVTREIQREQKLKRLESQEELDKLQPGLGSNELLFWEMNHRIKNQMQMLSSLMRIRGRNAAAETQELMQEWAAQVDAIATTYDFMARSEQTLVPVMPMLEKAAGLFRALSGDVCVTVSGEQLWLPGEQAITLVITASELMINAKKHAFAGRSGGTICLSLQNGNAVATLTVSDDGMGFDQKAVRRGGGIGLLTNLVQEKLGGEIRWYSDDRGTRATVTIDKKE